MGLKGRGQGAEEGTLCSHGQWVGPRAGGPWHKFRLDPEAPRACEFWGSIRGYSGRRHNALCPTGREVSPAHQYALAGGVSFPFFWLAGAGSAVFWVLGEYRVWAALWAVGAR